MIRLNLASKLQRRTNCFGIAPICNLRPERAPYSGAFVFPLCYRCTGVIVGIIIATPIKQEYLDLGKVSMVVLVLVLTMPMILDGILQKLKFLLSTNTRRAVTGLLFGIGLDILHLAKF